MSACVSEDCSGKGEINYHGLILCYGCEIRMRTDMDALERLDGSDPERAHAAVDTFLMRWTPAPLRAAVVEVMKRQPWWDCA